MELTEEILDDDELFAAWVEGSQRILHDEDREPTERIHAGCALATLATHAPGRPTAPWGTRPVDLAERLHETWDVAFDDDAVVQDRVDAALVLYQGLAEAAVVEDEGTEILRRELGL